MGKGPAVCLVFDDGHSTNYTEAFPRLAARGWKGSLEVVTSWVNGVDRVSLSQLHEMVKAGWGVSNHTVTHRAFNTLTTEEIQLEVSNADNWMRTYLGVAPVVFTYPYYIYENLNGESVKPWVSTYYKYQCQGSGQGWDGLPSDKILRRELNDTSYVDVPSWLDLAKASGTVLILQTHRVGIDISIANFESALNAVAASQLPVESMEALIGPAISTRLIVAIAIPVVAAISLGAYVFIVRRRRT